MVNVRRLAVEALTRVHGAGGYSSIVLDNLISQKELTDVDRALLSHLFYGVIERRLTLDYVLEQGSSTKLRKMHPTVREILRLGAYQILYMDRIPVSAAVNEAVKLTRAMGQPRASGLVNALLRRVDREGKAWLEALPTTLAGHSIRHSCPEELLRLWSDAYGEEIALALAADSNETADTHLRVNTLQTTAKQLGERLSEHNISYKIDILLQNCISLNANFGRKTLVSEAKKWYYHQDRASQLCCEALGAQPGEQIIDVCAAPGGKSLTTAQYMNNQGKILACDIYPEKCHTMRRRAEQFGVSILETRVRDASLPCTAEEYERFDRVICDVPCSGLGAIRRKPEIRYKPLSEFADLPSLQYKILCASADLVKRGGVLQYSTCTLNPAENEEVVDRFMREHTDFEPITLPLTACFEVAGLPPSWQLTLLPPIHQTDGFFIAAMRKKE